MDGLTHPEVMKLASLGNQGVQASHCSRDLVRSLGPAFEDLPAVSYLSVPVQGHREVQPQDIQMEVQFPHDVFSHYSKTPAAFERVFGSDAEIQSFWNHKDLSDPAYVHHPALLKQDFRSKCVPLKLHSDGVVMSKTESLHVMSWSSFFGKGEILEWQVLFAAVVKSAKCTFNGRETLSEIYRCYRWSLTACLEGVHPTMDHNEVRWPRGSQRARLAGQPLNPDGKFLAVFQILGDLDELCNSLGLSHFNSGQPCFWCGCNTRELPWTDFSPAAGWRDTQILPQPVMPPPSEHEVWNVPGVTVLSVGWDILHGLDLGPTQHVLGNCLEDLVQKQELGASAEARVRAIWARAVQIYRELGIENRLPHLELGTFRHAKDYPRLRGKGNESRHFLPVVNQLLLEMDQSNTQYCAKRQEMLNSLLRFYAIVDETGFFLTEAAAEEGKLMIMKFLQNYTWLAKRAIQSGQLRWQITIKMHYLVHAAGLLRWSNLRHSSTYPGEAFVGKAAKIAFSASLGKPPHLLGGLLMQKIQASRAVRLRKALT